VVLQTVHNLVDFDQAESTAKVDWAEAMAVVPQPVAVAYRLLAALAGHIASHNILVAHSALEAAGAVVVLRFPRCSFTTFGVQCNYIILRFRTLFVTILSCPYTNRAGSTRSTRCQERASLCLKMVVRKG